MEEALVLLLHADLGFDHLRRGDSRLNEDSACAASLWAMVETIGKGYIVLAAPIPSVMMR